jgi:hypothetical protein
MPILTSTRNVAHPTGTIAAATAFPVYLGKWGDNTHYNKVTSKAILGWLSFVAEIEL